MYLEHFGLSRKPFEQMPDPDFLYLTDNHEQALTKIGFAVAIEDSFVVVTGEIGSGKTTLLQKFLAEHIPNSVVAYVTQTQLSEVELLQSILVELGQDPFGKGKVELSTMLKRFIESNDKAGKRVVIVIDEAQNLTATVLEELRLLTCSSLNSRAMVNVVLVGQPQFNRTFDAPGLLQLRQRCRLRYHLKALSLAETEAYIGHRIQVADGDVGTIFEPDVLSLVFERTNGIPRLVNMLCDTALICAFVDKETRVTEKDIEQAMSELRWECTQQTHKHDDSEVGDNEHGLGTHSLKLTQLENNNEIATFVVKSGPCLMGRAKDCQIPIKSPSISRYHAVIRQRDSQQWIVSDLKSTNKSKVNDKPIQAVLLRDRDRLTLGRVSFDVRIVASELVATTE